MSFAVGIRLLVGRDGARRALRSEFVRHRRCRAVRRGLRRHGHPDVPHPPDESASCAASRRGSTRRPTAHWEISEAQERAKSFFEAQGDVIVRRDGNGAITYANDAFCALAGRPREDAAGHRRSRCRCEAAGRDHDCSPTARASTIRKSPRPTARAGSPGAKSPCAPISGKRDAKRRPRRHRSRQRRARAGRCARSGRSRQPRQVALPGHGLARNPHAAERHPRHGRSAGRHAAGAGADDLSQGDEDLGRHACCR